MISKKMQSSTLPHQVEWELDILKIVHNFEISVGGKLTLMNIGY